MYEKESKTGIIIMIDKQDAATLIPIIQDYVRPGSIIHSDEWLAYQGLVQLGFDHWVVVHADNFVDHITAVHINGVESYLSQAKLKIKAVYRYCHPLIPSYLNEYMWQERYGLHTAEPSHNILKHIAEQY